MFQSLRSALFFATWAAAFLCPVAVGAQVVSLPGANDSGPAIRPVSPYDDVEVPEKVYEKEDKITILVDERTNATNNTNLRVQKESKYGAELADFVGLRNGSLVDQLDGTLGIDLTSQKEQNSRGQQTVTRQVTSRFTARVIDVLPNGHLVLEARRHRRVDFEEETLILFGVVDPAHVNKQADTVPSERLADLDLQIIPRGSIADSERRGFLSWLWDHFWPF